VDEAASWSLFDAFDAYLRRLEDEADAARLVAERASAICGLPWPPSLGDVRPTCCQLPAGHDGCVSCGCSPAFCREARVACCSECSHSAHSRWVGAVEVTWPALAADG
jgi:hypothetical protein